MFSLFKFFMKLLRKLRRFPVYEIDVLELERMLRENESVRMYFLWDKKYKFTDFESMMKIIKYDVVKLKEYRAEVYDCDNFATSFAGLVPFLYEINNVGIAVGRVIDESGNVGYHAWNIFIAMKSDRKPMLYMYEPQSGKFSTYKEGRIGKWKYKPDIVIWG